ncbi:MAG: murein biosynthesis integral membrane protein MurJ [Gammaproteobacteria bacterium]
MTMISRVLGFVRDMVIARLFGAGTGADAFFIAFRIPNFWRRLFAEGAFSQAFVPVLAEYKEKRAHEEVRLLMDHVSGVLGLVLFGVTLLGVIAAPLLVMIFAPGFLDEADRYGLTVTMLRITFPYLLFVSLAAMAGAILNSYGRFGVPAFTPVFLNLALIGSAIWLAPHLEHPVTALAWGVFIGGILQLLFQLPFLHRLHLFPRLRWGWGDEGVRRIIKLMGPAIFGVSVTQINLLFDTLIASFLVAGSVSWLYYSDRLVELPLGVFGIALATVMLPNLSRQNALAETEKFSQSLDWAIRWVWLIGAPATVGLVLLAGPLLTTLFRYGEFSAHDMLMSSYSLMAFGVGLPGYIFIKILAPAFYARQDTRTPVRIGVIAMLTNMVLNMVFVIPLAKFGLGHAGIALATALAAFLNAGLLYRALRRTGAYRAAPGWKQFAAQVAGANLVMAAVLWMGMGDLSQWLQWPAMTRGGRLALLVGVAALAYLVSLWAFGLRLTALVMKPGSQ